MRLHTFIVESDLSKKEITISDLAIIKQIKNVLRLQNGDFLNLSDGKGVLAKCKILEIKKDQIICEILKKEKSQLQNKKVHLFLAILKKENFELALQKAIECGASSITPVKTQRTIKNNLNETRLIKITKEASEQSGQTFLPKINKIKSFEEAILEAQNFERKILFDMSGEEIKADKNAKEVCVFVGPEGGFTKEEIEKAKNLNYQIASLSSLVLRAETAGIVATYKEVNSLD